MASIFGFDLKALEVFVQVAETGNMTVAAERLGMTQSAVSQTLSNLESNLSSTLLDRSVRPIEMTAAGRFLYDRASSLLSEARKTSQDIRKSNFQQLRQVNVAMVDSLATAVGRPLLEAVKRRTRDWSLTTGLSHMHAHGLMSRAVDIIISDDNLDEYTDLVRYQILREPFILALPNDYKGDPGDLQELNRKMDFVRYSAHSLIGQTIERYLRHIPLEPAQRLRLDNSYAVVSMVASGAGWTITTPLCLFQSGIRLHQVNCVPLPQEAPFRHLTLVARQGELSDLPKEIAEDSRQILRDSFLAEVAQELPWLMDQISIG